MKRSIVLLLILITAFLGTEIRAQDADSTLYRIELKNGDVFIGSIISETEEALVLMVPDVGEIQIEVGNIKSRHVIDSSRIKDGEYWYDNPHGTRYLFSTNAIGLKKGEGYYQNTWVFFNNVNYGITDNFSMGAGMIPLFLFGTPTPVWLMPKISVPLAHNNFHAAVGGMFGGIVGGEDNFGVGLAYGAITTGNLDNNFTLAVGFGYGDGEWSNVPLFNVNGMKRLNRTIYLITENYLVSVGGETVGLISGAVRWAPENLAIDFGLFRPFVLSEDLGGGFIGVPWLGIAIPFGGE